MAANPTTRQDEDLINFQSALTELGDNIAIIDREYRIIFQNTLCRKISNLKIGTQCYKGFRNQNTACHDCPAQKVFEGKGISRAEQIHSGKENNEQWLELIASPLSDTGGGETIAAIIIQRDVTASKRMSTERDLLIEQLQWSMNKIRSLNGIVSICMFCKKTRDEDQEWIPIETFLRHRLDVELSHGICLECGQKHYPAFVT